MMVAGMLLLGCARVDHPVAQRHEDPFDQIHTAPFTSADPATHHVQPLPAGAYQPRWIFSVHPAVPTPLPPVDRIHPTVRQWILTRPPTDMVELFVTFRDTVALRPFHRPMLQRPRTDGNNERAMDSVQTFIDTLAAHRRFQYDADSTALKSAYGARLMRTFWLLQGMALTMPLGKVDSLSHRPGVVFIRPNVGDPPPHHDSNTRNDMDTARRRIGSDHYFDLGLGYGWIALLDTGVRTTHHLLCGDPPQLCLVTNCVTGGCGEPYSITCVPLTECLSSAGGDMVPVGHGTASATILSGNERMGPSFRGVTRAELDCFTVYGTDAQLRVDATVAAFEEAIARLDPVIVAEMQENTLPDIADVSAAADHAYTTGYLVIAANGNEAYWGSGEPARSRRVIGVGGYDLESETDLSEAWGLTSDERIKPDIQAPSMTETAGAESDDDVQYFGGTSGATPYAAGAASLLRNWMAVGLDGVDPGQVYAGLILSGDKSGPYDAMSSEGAGKIRLPATGTCWWGKVSVSTAVEKVDVPIDVAETGNIRVAAAIWWPEAPIAEGDALLDGHNDLDLEIKGPHGLRAWSESRVGVFERAQTVGDANGHWKLRIHPITMRSEPQTVYWCLSAVPVTTP
jgi:hypothetical protein